MSATDGRLPPAAQALVWKLKELLPPVAIDWTKVQEEMLAVLRDQIPCGDCIDGWSPGDRGIERCDTCTRFADDDEAASHVANAIRTLIAAYGPDDPLEVVLQHALREE